MSRPSRYPQSDSREQESLGVLIGLLPPDFIKVDIKTRDKYPNVDGTVEIIDEIQSPIAKFDVQLKSIPEDQTYFDCPRELADYSDISTLPILLICVDSANKRAFWKHINRTMPQYKENQKTFRVIFSEEIDLIDEKGLFISRWLNIAQEYQKRLATYQYLQEIIDEQLKLSTVPPEDIRLFQGYIDGLNSLLDGELAGFKSVLFPATWKLGVSIFYSGTDRVGYQLYRIPEGKPAPLVVGKLEGLLAKGEANPNVFLEVSMSRESLKEVAGFVWTVKCCL